MGKGICHCYVQWHEFDHQKSLVEEKKELWKLPFDLHLHVLSVSVLSVSVSASISLTEKENFKTPKLLCIKWVAEINIWQSPKDYIQNQKTSGKKITWNWCFKSMLQRNDNYPRVRKYDARTVEITTGENKPSAPITEMEIANFKEMRAYSWYSQFVCELYLSSIKKSPSLVLLYVAIF